MGSEQVTVKNLEVVEVNTETNELWVKGAVPGARNGVVVISTPEGKIEVETLPVEAPIAAEPAALAPAAPVEEILPDETPAEPASAAATETAEPDEKSA